MVLASLPAEGPWGLAARIGLVWAFYAFGTTSRWPGLLGNAGILLLALLAMRLAWTHSRTTALLIAPVAAWITFASASIVDGARRFGW